MSISIGVYTIACKIYAIGLRGWKLVMCNSDNRVLQTVLTYRAAFELLVLSVYTGVEYVRIHIYRQSVSFHPERIRHLYLCRQRSRIYNHCSLNVSYAILYLNPRELSVDSLACTTLYWYPFRQMQPVQVNPGHKICKLHIRRIPEQLLCSVAR